MLIRNATQEQIENAAKEVGLRLYDLRPVNKKETAFRLRLKTAEREIESVGPRGGIKLSWPKYGRLSVHLNRFGKNARIPGAVCWHGHREFMRALYRLTPHARIETALATYNGVLEFETKFPETYYKNAGSMVNPQYYGNLCDCEREGSAVDLEGAVSEA